MFKKQILTFSPTLMSKFFAYCMSTTTLIWIFILIHAIKTTRHHRLASIMNKLASLFPLWYLMIDTVSYHISKKTVNIFICLLWSDCGFTIFLHCQQKLIFFFHLWSGLNLNLNTPVLIKYINKKMFSLLIHEGMKS